MSVDGGYVACCCYIRVSHVSKWPHVDDGDDNDVLIDYYCSVVVSVIVAVVVVGGGVGERLSHG